MAFSRTTLFLDQSSHEFWLSNKCYKSVSSCLRPESSISDVLMIFTSHFSFFILHVQMRTHTKRYFPNFAGKCSKMMLKINWSMKTQLHRVLSILPNQPVRNQWNYQEKIERHFSVETKFSIESSDPFTFRPKVWLLISNVGRETRIFGNGTGSFGRTGPTGQRGPLWGGPLWPENFHLDRTVPFAFGAKFPEILA